MSTVYSLDLVISDESFIENIELDAPIGKSDHCSRQRYKLILRDFNLPYINWKTGNTSNALENLFVDMLRKCKFKPVKCCLIDKYALSREDYDGLRSSLQSLNWKELLSQYPNNIYDM